MTTQLSKTTKRTGLFLSMDGPDGVGKTLQLKAIHDELLRRGVPVIRTREPGGTNVGEKLRDIVVKGEPGELSAMAELLIFTAGRVEHIRQLIAPSLEKGCVILCDRNIASTRAYQGAGRGLPLETINAIHQASTGGFEPDLTILIDLDPAIALPRSKARLAASSSAEDRFEKEQAAFHARVSESYKAQASENPERWLVVDGTGTEKMVFTRIMQGLDQRFGVILRAGGIHPPERQRAGSAGQSLTFG